MKYKIGDKVRVKPLEDCAPIGRCVFVEAMHYICGNQFSIEEMEGDKVIYDCWSLPFEWLEPVSALRYNSGKPKWSLVHMQSLVPMIRVLEHGAEKYEPYNWKKPTERHTLIDSLQRHMADLIDGKEIDDDSGLPIIGHIMANAMFYSYHFVEKEK